jgi:alkaline phosphatase
MLKHLFIFLISIAVVFSSSAQVNDSLAVFTNPNPHSIVELGSPEFKSKPKNIILFIADGMATAQVFAAITANGGKLNLNHMKYIGFTQTQSADNYITDSAAGGTAIATGQRVKNGYVALDENNKPIKTILQICSENGKATGLVSTSGITHATPASFIAHQPSRNMYEEIAADFLKTDIDLFIGGGLKHFTDRKDGRNLVSELENKGYKVFRSIDAASSITTAPLAILTADEHNPDFESRGEMLTEATQKSIDILSKNKDGFFVMIEGSQIDWGGHANSTPYIVGEMLDTDKAVGAALRFAAQNKETLVIVVSDHETGGMSITGGDIKNRTVKAVYNSTNHTAEMVPVFAYGPGAIEFIGIYDNTDLFFKMMKVLGL